MPVGEGFQALFLLRCGGFDSLGGLFPPQRKTVRDHGDKFAVGGLALDVGDGVAEELLHGRNVIYRTVYRYRLL